MIGLGGHCNAGTTSLIFLYGQQLGNGPHCFRDSLPPININWSKVATPELGGNLRLLFVGWAAYKVFLANYLNQLYFVFLTVDLDCRGTAERAAIAAC